MAMIEVIEVGEDIRIGFDAEAGETGQIQVMWNDEVTETFDALESVYPACCATCIEASHWVEMDGRCPHGKPSYALKVGLV